MFLEVTAFKAMSFCGKNCKILVGLNLTKIAVLVMYLCHHDDVIDKNVIIFLTENVCSKNKYSIIMLENYMLKRIEKVFASLASNF